MTTACYKVTSCCHNLYRGEPARRLRSFIERRDKSKPALNFILGLPFFILHPPGFKLYVSFLYTNSSLTKEASIAAATSRLEHS